MQTVGKVMYEVRSCVNIEVPHQMQVQSPPSVTEADWFCKGLKVRLTEEFQATAINIKVKT